MCTVEYRLTKLAENLYIAANGINTGVLVSGKLAILFNCGDGVTLGLLNRLGIERVDKILCTQYRRSTAAGIYNFAGAEIIAPKKEAALFENTEGYWSDPVKRWHVYHFMPDTDVLPRSVAPVVPVSEGDVIHWEGFEITVYDTPGATHGGVSYAVRAGGKDFSFCGDIVYSGGRIYNIWTLARPMNELTGYHGFMASRGELLSSAAKIASLCDTLIPTRGPVISDPRGEVSILKERLDRLYENYASTSSLNYYFPGLVTRDMRESVLMTPAKIMKIPDFIRTVDFTSRVIISDSGAAFLIDCGKDTVVETLEIWLKEGVISSLEGCWVTHYHDDHVDALGLLKQRLGTNIYCCRQMSDILEHPNRYFLPCISPVSVPVTSLDDGDAFPWREFRFTLMHYPGQTLYHGGLLVEGRGAKVLFAGDSGTPNGLDDYCVQNRVFLGAGRGSRKTLEILRRRRPDCILNQHVPKAFYFSEEQIDFMERALVEREKIYETLFPWPAPDYGLDDSWLRTYPYEQTVRPGDTTDVELHVTNHCRERLEISARLLPPEGWLCEAEKTIELAPLTCGIAAGQGIENGDAAIPFKLTIPRDARPGRYIVPFAITLGGTHHGCIKHTIIDVAQFD